MVQGARPCRAKETRRRYSDRGVCERRAVCADRPVCSAHRLPQEPRRHHCCTGRLSVERREELMDRLFSSPPQKPEAQGLLRGNPPAKISCARRQSYPLPPPGGEGRVRGAPSTGVGWSSPTLSRE